MEIIKKDQDGVTFYTVAATGQSGMSQNGLAKLAGVSPKTLRNLEATLRISAPSESLEPFVGKDVTLRIKDPTIEGKSAGNLSVYKSLYCAAVLRHFAAEEEAKQAASRPATYSALKFLELGIDKWIQGITGWTDYQETIQPHTGVYITRLENVRDHEIDDDHWMIFREAAELLLLVEKEWRVPINDFDILDGSIGRCWSDYRKSKPWADEIGTYTHSYRDKRGPRECNAYKWSEKSQFQRWLRTVYVPKYLPRYLVTKYGKSATRMIYTENGQLDDDILALTEVKRKSPKDEKLFQHFLVARQKLIGPAE